MQIHLSRKRISTENQQPALCLGISKPKHPGRGLTSFSLSVVGLRVGSLHRAGAQIKVSRSLCLGNCWKKQNTFLWLRNDVAGTSWFVFKRKIWGFYWGFFVLSLLPSALFLHEGVVGAPGWRGRVGPCGMKIPAHIPESTKLSQF